MADAKRQESVAPPAVVSQHPPAISSCLDELFLGVPEPRGRSFVNSWVLQTGSCCDRAVIPTLSDSAGPDLGESCKPTASSLNLQL